MLFLYSDYFAKKEKMIVFIIFKKSHSMDYEFNYKINFLKILTHNHNIL